MERVMKKPSGGSFEKRFQAKGGDKKEDLRMGGCYSRWPKKA